MMRESLIFDIFVVFVWGFMITMRATTENHLFQTHLGQHKGFFSFFSMFFSWQTKGQTDEYHPWNARFLNIRAFSTLEWRLGTSHLDLDLWGCGNFQARSDFFWISESEIFSTEENTTSGGGRFKFVGPFSIDFCCKCVGSGLLRSTKLEWFFRWGVFWSTPPEQKLLRL